ncbi:nucleoporin, partial [Reticulomyxa filosa]
SWNWDFSSSSTSTPSSSGNSWSWDWGGTSQNKPKDQSQDKQSKPQIGPWDFGSASAKSTPSYTVNQMLYLLLQKNPSQLLADDSKLLADNSLIDPLEKKRSIAFPVPMTQYLRSKKTQTSSHSITKDKGERKDHSSQSSQSDSLTLATLPLQSQLEKSLSEQAVYPQLNNKDYYSIPSITCIRSMTLDQLRQVSDFTIGNKFGKITFPGKTNLCGVNLDDVVTIQWKSARVYYKNNINIPPIVSSFLFLCVFISNSLFKVHFFTQGTGLNKYAKVELYQVFPLPPPNAEEGWKPSRADMHQLSLQLEYLCSKDENATFDSFDLNRGIWKLLLLQIKHTTQYFQNKRQLLFFNPLAKNPKLSNPETFFVCLVINIQ